MYLLFWISIFFILYPYIGYPVLLALRAYLMQQPVQKEDIWPRVSILVAAYNEEKVILERLKNIIKQDYPVKKMEVIVISDGSTDGTNNIVLDFIKRHAKIDIFLDYDSVRKGKSAALKRGVQSSRGEVVVFTDANSSFRSMALKKLVRSFADSRVGSVAGKVGIICKDEFKTSEGEGIYWRLEDFIRRQESMIHSVIGADGSIYAIRKDLFIPPEEGVGYSDDFIIAMQVIPQGYRLVYEPEAAAGEESSRDFSSEFKRKIRSTSGGLHGYLKLFKKGMFNPFSSPIWWQLISHRVMRFAVPWAMILLFLSNIFLQSSFYKSILVAQICFYIFALLGLLLPENIIKKRIFYIPCYLTLMQFIFIPSLYRFVRGKTETKWEKIGRE